LLLLLAFSSLALSSLSLCSFLRSSSLRGLLLSTPLGSRVSIGASGIRSLSDLLVGFVFLVGLLFVTARLFAFSFSISAGGGGSGFFAARSVSSGVRGSPFLSRSF
jgi:hypothetical protein